MRKHRRTIWDDLKDIGNEILNRLDDLMNPNRRKPQRVPVPIPVRNDDPRRHNR